MFNLRKLQIMLSELDLSPQMTPVPALRRNVEKAILDSRFPVKRLQIKIRRLKLLKGIKKEVAEL